MPLIIARMHSLCWSPLEQAKLRLHAAGGGVDTDYGTFLILRLRKMFQDDHIDNRKNPPDHGCLLQIGQSRESGEGEFCEFDDPKSAACEEQLSTNQ